jgi:hypothetical protein
MTAWQAFALGCFVMLALYGFARAALWIARSRPLADVMEGEHGDQPHLGG